MAFPYPSHFLFQILQCLILCAYLHYTLAPLRVINLQVPEVGKNPKASIFYAFYLVVRKRPENALITNKNIICIEMMGYVFKVLDQTMEEVVDVTKQSVCLIATN